MNVHQFQPGQRVIILDTNPEWAFVHGWVGTVAGWKPGAGVIFRGKNDDGQPVEFYVPPDMLGAI